MVSSNSFDENISWLIASKPVAMLHVDHVLITWHGQWLRIMSEVWTTSLNEYLRQFPQSLCRICLCWGLTSQSTTFQSCRDGATASWVINQYFRGVKCLAQGHNTAAVGFEPPTSRSIRRKLSTKCRSRRTVVRRSVADPCSVHKKVWSDSLYCTR